MPGGPKLASERPLPTEELVMPVCLQNATPANPLLQRPDMTYTPGFVRNHGAKSRI